MIGIGRNIFCTAVLIRRKKLGFNFRTQLIYIIRLIYSKSRDCGKVGIEKRISYQVSVFKLIQLSSLTSFIISI